jgi:ribosomal protein S18 acetylase RimI-like enzyme
VIRLYEPRDLDQLRWLHDRTPPAGRIATRPQGWFPELDDIAANFDAFWVALEQQDGKEALVGAVAVQDARRPATVPPPPGLTEGRAARLRAMRVAPERQRRGIGRMLTQTVVDWAVAGGYDSLVLDTTDEQHAAIALYEAMGFKEQARSSFGKYAIVWFELVLGREPEA